MIMKVLTPSEEKLLNALKDSDTVALAAQKVHLKPKTCYNILYRLRRKYYRARKLVNTIEPLRGHYDTVALVLTDRRAEVEEKKKLEAPEEKPAKDETDFTEKETEEKWEDA